MRISLLFALTLVACSQPEVDNRLPVVRAFGESLYLEELQQVIPESATAEDSTYIADAYIRNWLTEQAVINQAEISLPDQQKDFTEALDKHRRALLTHAYEEELIRQRLDTAVADSEIQSFYEENKGNFLLKDYVVKVRFCMLDSGDWDIREFRKLFDDPEDEQQEVLEAFCLRYHGACFLEEDRWVYLQELLEEVPIPVDEPEGFLKKNKSVELEAGNRVIFLRVLDYILAGEVSPVSLQREKIRALILNRRKAQLLDQMREDVYRQALKKNQIEYVDQP